MSIALVRRIEKRIWDHPTHTTYWNMKARCYNENCREFPYYGGRGITVCDKWLNDKWEFVAWAYESGWQKGKSLNRIDNNGPYAPWNCEWTTRFVQGNNKRNNVLLEAFGETKTAKEWSRDSRCKVSYRRLMRRTQNFNWDHELAIITPPLPAGAGRRSWA